MILYVPFPRSQASDLVERVDTWKNNQSQLTNDSIHIIYHGDDFDFDATPVLSLEIYICAHGYSDNYPLVVGNNADEGKAEFLKIRTVTDRFNQDFGAVFHQISAIHLYCCGSQNKNKQMAEEFRVDLLPKDKPIHSYSGAISTPDSNGIRWSFNGTQKIPVQNTKSVLFKDEPPEKMPWRMFKAAGALSLHEKAREERRNRFFDEGKSARQAEVQRRRNISSMEMTPTNVVPSSVDGETPISAPTTAH